MEGTATETNNFKGFCPDCSMSSNKFPLDFYGFQ